MKSVVLIICFIFIFCMFSFPEVKLYLAPQYSQSAQQGEMRALSLESLADKNFPKPFHSQPVLFIHDHESGSGNKSFLENWQLSYKEFTSFQHTLDLPENAHLDIEPYYIDLEDYTNQDEKINRSLEEDARKIREAVGLILLHHGDPGAVSKKVSIIAYGKGAISARLYLKTLWEEQNKSFAFLPVSELIAISPPNHGIRNSEEWGENCLSLRQLANGFDANGKSYEELKSLHFIETLNGHSIQDSIISNYCASIFDSEAPGCRRNNKPLDKGILYLTFYSTGNSSITGGDYPSDDCQGRVLAKNLAPLAENREIPVMIADSSMEVHRTMVHNSTVISDALYTAAYNQTPPFESAIELSQPSNPNSPPIVPPFRISQEERGVVFLLDISQSMVSILPIVQKIVTPFITLLEHYWKGKANLGVAVFPALPWSCQPQKEGCTQTIDTLTRLSASSAEYTVKTIGCLESQGYTPLLKGIDTAVEMFGTEKNKSIVLISDGRHNYPFPVHETDLSVKEKVAQLEEKNIDFFSIGIGFPLGVSPVLMKMNIPPKNNHFSQRGDHFNVIVPEKGSISSVKSDDAVIQEHLSNAFYQHMKSIIAQLLELTEGATVSGRIQSGEMIPLPLSIDRNAQKITYLLTWNTPGKKRLNLTLKSSEASTPLKNNSLNVSEGDTFQLVTFIRDEPESAQWEEYQPLNVHLEAPGLSAGEKESYRCSVLMESPVQMKMSFDRLSYYSGDSLTISVAITKSGQLVSGLTNVKLTVIPPAEGVGNWFSQHYVSDMDLSSVADSFGDESLTPLEKKTLFLVEKRGETFPGNFQANSGQEFILYDDGTHGDKNRGDGIYSFQIQSLNTEGIYSFGVNVVTDEFKLEQNKQKYVAVKPVPDQSVPEILWYDTTSGDPEHYLYNIRFVPKDSVGNFLGPGHKVEVAVVYLHALEQTETASLEDRLDGVYNGTVEILPSALNKKGVQLEFRIDGHLFTTVDKIPVDKKKALGLFFGVGVPAFAYSNTCNGSINIGAQLEYRFSPQFSMLGTLGYNRFKIVSSHELESDNSNVWWNLSANLKSEIGKSRFRVFVNVGPGIYISGDGDIQSGINLGMGGTYSLKSGWGIDVGMNFHHVFTGLVPDPNFFVTYFKLLYRF